MRVLIVEDEPYLAEAVRDGLRLEAVAADIAGDGDTALELLSVNSYDIAVLDRDIPGPSGDEVARWIVASGSGIPILMLTAADRLDDKESGFEIGADDYLTKPFALAEVRARLLALIHRARGAVVDAVREFGPLQFDGRTRAVSVAGQPVRLTRKSGLLVEALLRDPGRVVPREELEAVLWGDEPPSADALRSQMHLLRRALAEAGFDGIETVHGVGWRLVAPGAGA